LEELKSSDEAETFVRDIVRSSLREEDLLE
jgi:hypothetical protein